MCKVFEIIEKDEMDWIEVMMCESKEKLCSNMMAYTVSNEQLKEYLIYNEELDRCILLRTDSDYKAKDFVVNFNMQSFLQSPDSLKGIVVYNLTKMTHKCFRFKLRCWMLRIFDFIINILDNIRYWFDGTEVSVIILIIMSLCMIAIIIKLYMTGGIC